MCWVRSPANGPKPRTQGGFGRGAGTAPTGWKEGKQAGICGVDSNRNPGGGKVVSYG